MNSSSNERGDAQMPNARPYSSIDIPEVINRNSAARDIVAGFAIATPTLSPAWQTVATALADARDLAAEVARLSDRTRGRASRTRQRSSRDASRNRRTARRRSRPPVIPPRRAPRGSERLWDA